MRRVCKKGGGKSRRKEEEARQRGRKVLTRVVRVAFREQW